MARSLATRLADVYGHYCEGWDDGPHLAGVSSLTLSDYNPEVLFTALKSPHLIRLESLKLHDPALPWETQDYFADELAAAVVLPRMRQLKRLTIPVPSERVAQTLAGAPNLSELTALDVHLLTEFEDDASSRWLAILARSPYLAGLHELSVSGLSAVGLEAAIRNPTWKRLRKLELDVQFCDGLDQLADTDDLPELDELRLTGIRYSTRELAALARSPLLKRLRHFAARSFGFSADFDIAYAVDSDRIETFAIWSSDAAPRVVAMLKERFGNKFRLLP